MKVEIKRLSEPQLVPFPRDESSWGQVLYIKVHDHIFHLYRRKLSRRSEPFIFQALLMMGRRVNMVVVLRISFLKKQEREHFIDNDIF